MPGASASSASTASPASPRVSVVIPNWNGAAHLPECMDSLAQQTFADFETTVVDNGSKDESLALLAERYPWASVIALDDNRGFSAAVNRGIEASRAEYVVLMNNDTRACPDWLERLVEAMDRHPQASFAACRMLLYDPPHDIDSAGDSFSLFSGGKNIGAGEPADSHDRLAWVFGACAGAAIYRRSLFDDIGLFDEDFFLIYEDVDIDLRAQVAGHRCLYVPDAVIYHKRGASTNLVDVRITARAWRNMIWVAGKSLPPFLLLVWAVLFALHLGWRTLMFVLRRLVPRFGAPPDDAATDASEAALRGSPWWRASTYARATRDGLAALPAKRRSERHRRRLGSLALARVLLRPVRPVEPSAGARAVQE
ncbi:MAG TPA: glycosyltransferase family 2 protein [Wenzhouxiangella sp.]|nr:glycosyltransferase family 2 protein [Wenzhouxiangella sp.]